MVKPPQDSWLRQKHKKDAIANVIKYLFMITPCLHLERLFIADERVGNPYYINSCRRPYFLLIKKDFLNHFNLIIILLIRNKQFFQ